MTTEQTQPIDVWAPAADTVQLVTGTDNRATAPMTRDDAGWWHGMLSATTSCWSTTSPR